jgi:hypothetical protein
MPPDNFCPNCGAPQLLYEVDADNPNLAASPAMSATRDIQWKTAIGAAVTFAVPVGLLCSSAVPLLSSGCCLWVVGGAVAAVGLYQRRAASALLTRRVGVRIGTIIGVMAAVVASAFNAGAAVFQRYALHGGDAMEKAFQTSMEQGSAIASQFISSSPAQAKEALDFWISPDGRAAATLLTALLTSAGITVFSMIGGALGTRIFSGRNASLRNS